MKARRRLEEAEEKTEPVVKPGLFLPGFFISTQCRTEKCIPLFLALLSVHVEHFGQRLLNR